MKYAYLIAITATALLASCSTAYKSGQTPDDVYYSPATTAVTASNDKYEAPVNNEDDRYLRMKVRNNTRWSSIDDFNYWYTPYSYYGYSYNPYLFSSYYNPYNHIWFNSYYPYGGLGFTPGYYYYPYYPVVKNPVKTARTDRPYLGGYNNTNNNNNNNANRSTLRKVFTPNNNNYNNRNSGNNNNNTYTAPTRTYTPSSSGGSSGGSSSGSSSGGGVSRPARKS
jgi:uncharacterized membrane protein YgcG